VRRARNVKRVGRRDARSLLSNIKSQEPAHKGKVHRSGVLPSRHE